MARRAAKVLDQLEKGLSHLGVRAPRIFRRESQFLDHQAKVPHLVSGRAIIRDRLTLLLRGVVAIAGLLKATQKIGHPPRAIARLAHRDSSRGLIAAG
jgi:hypothetical protein